MRALKWGAALPLAMAILLTAAGCAREEAAQNETAAAPESAAPAAAATGDEAAAPANATVAAAPAAPAGSAAPAGEAPAAAPATASAADGAKTYQAFCVTCHGAKGAGDGLAAAGLNPKPASFQTRAFKYDVNGNGTKGDIEDIKAIVRDGAAKHGGSPLMAPWPMLSPAQLQAVAEYVQSLGA